MTTSTNVKSEGGSSSGSQPFNTQQIKQLLKMLITSSANDEHASIGEMYLTYLNTVSCYFANTSKDQ